MNRIVAVVNERVITLTDLQVAYAFGLFEQQSEKKAENPLLFVLQRIVDQEVVLEAESENISVEESELDKALTSVMRRFGHDEFEKKLRIFDLSLADFQVFLVRKIIFQKIISRKFEKGIAVSLEEIEAYYSDVYLPQQEKRGEVPRPLTEMLAEIEARVKEEKKRKQIERWISSLKQQAEIEIKFESIMEIKRGEEWSSYE